MDLIRCIDGLLAGVGLGLGEYARLLRTTCWVDGE